MKAKKQKIDREGTGALMVLGVLALGAVSAALGAAVATSDEYETCLAHPDHPPKGKGWKPMQAVTHTSLYGGLMGKPVGRVVWQRRKPRPEPESTPPPWLRVSA
jgi:hypothetical protein